MRKAAELLPDDAEAHNNLGNVLQVLGQLDDAQASCARALEISPDYADAHNNLGNVLTALGQFNGAVASMPERWKSSPVCYADTHYNLGNVLQDLGQFEEAAASHRRALVLTSFPHEAKECSERRATASVLAL